MRPASMIALLACCLAGCAHYEYDIVKPPELARHIATKVDTVVTLDPLEYRFRTVDNRLVMRVFNQTDDPIQLLGDKSAAVDPHGQSHPLRSQTIAPHSFIKLILPPPPLRVYDPGPTIGFGVGIGVSRYYYRDPYYARCGYDYPPYPYYYDEPRYLYIYDDNDTRYWDWDGQTNVRLTLVYQRGSDKQIRHEFTFHRRKMSK